MNHNVDALDRTIDALASRLLERRIPDGWWEGHLASSALATATAIVALTLHQQARRADHAAIITASLRWLVSAQNTDGGWGDTTVSFSNLSTTLLCWAALRINRADGDADLSGRVRAAIERAETWLRPHSGDLDGPSLQHAVLERYGSDRTFSAPILAMLAATGQLGSGVDGWHLVPQLPFELAACPHSWWRWLRLSVVSYAMPALVAIGQVRHHHAQSRNAVLAAARSALRRRTLQVAQDMQPESGGYLEAVPLTAFVVASLVSAGAAATPIVKRGIAFLIRSARPDGSWPIDTNLSTWVTSLAVRALDSVGRVLRDAPETQVIENPVYGPDDRARIVRWLVDQQVRREHPFTHAQPGGWAWTDRSGGVPDADDTSGALLTIWRLAGFDELDTAAAGIRWLLDLQNHDGGIPTFRRGWGALPFDRSAPDLTAHAMEAWDAWQAAVPPKLRARIARAAARAMTYLSRQQRDDGSWAPLWFGNEHAPAELNLTYGTARVVSALATPLARRSAAADACHQRGVAWLLGTQNPDGGWGGGGGSPSSIEETGLALDALGQSPMPVPSLGDALIRGGRWLVEATDHGQRTPPSPIGLYFARLWYYEDLYPLVWSISGLCRVRMRTAIKAGTL